ncbi:MAG: hypothetical protein A3E56_01435 [Omnitrophica WOR_2 bacterium RIFCSPHIGHO2_12_FULL_64_13]|nr:MAG: hypothetical protein A3E56_01435 [Omnitrophica WOR_2 bacterium RIFCSPHIGHO2_12_FULL_64_13]
MLMVTAAVTVAFGPLVWDLVDVSWKRYTMRRRLQRLDAFHRALTEEHQRLTEDSVYVEGLIRSTFKVAKPGELVIPSDELTGDKR